MSAHRTLNDMYRAFDAVGPGIVDDPGASGIITFGAYGQICEMTSATTETRTVSRPTKPGIRAHLRLYSDGGDVTVTVTGGLNAAGDSVVVFGDAGDFIDLISVKASATTYRWEILTGHTYVGTVVLASTSASSSPSSSPSTSASSSPSAT